MNETSLKLQPPNSKLLAGASLERKAILARLRRMEKRWAQSSFAQVLVELIDWVLDRDTRYNRKPGGLQGRKKPKSKS